MTKHNITRQRLANQQITATKFRESAELVAWMCAMQAQDFLQSKWAIGVRLPGLTDADVERAIANATIVRTWPMRGTLHLVAAADIRWLLALSEPRMKAALAGRNRQLGLDEAIFSRCNELMVRALVGGKHLTRNELAAIFNEAGIATNENRLSHILQWASLERLICFGPKQGTEFAFTLLDEWVPPTKTLLRNEALAEMAARYFTSHGPATLQDFTWWSGLSVTDARAGLESAKSRLVSEIFEGQTYWLPQNLPAVAARPQRVFLLPGFDEYFIAYKNRTACLDPKFDARVVHVNGIFNPMLVIDGQVAGTWKRTFKKEKAVLEIMPFEPLDEAERAAVSAKAEEFGQFLGKKIVIGA